MLQKSLQTKSDVIIYDLEDSVAPADKRVARDRLANFLSTTAGLPEPERIAVRLNSVNTNHFHDDIVQAMKIPSIRTFVLPKIDTVTQLDHVSRQIFTAYQSNGRAIDESHAPLQLVASVESAKSLWNLNGIGQWKSEYGDTLGGKLGALLFAAEDYCADTGIIRTPSRTELLYTRSQIVLAAKAFGLKSIDMVCINYKDLGYLQEECVDGRNLGYDGKQAIHPSQVDTIQSTFVPTAKEIKRAARIIRAMEKAHGSNRGAVGLSNGEKDEMIDAPMIKQVSLVSSG
jgi:citrate lyase subunit beta-like protein